MFTRRRFLRSSLVGGALVLGVGFYTWRVEPHWLEVVERRLPVKRLPGKLAGSRLVQVSDLHIGSCVDDDDLMRSLERLHGLDADLGLYTGDFITQGPDFSTHASRMFKHFARGRRGTCLTDSGC